MDNSNLISLKRHVDYYAFIFALIATSLYIFFYSFMFRTIGSNEEYYIADYEFEQVMVLILAISILISIGWAYLIAKKTGRDFYIWITVCLAGGPIGLLILSLKDYNLKNYELDKVVKTTRLEYKNEIKKLKQDNQWQITKELKDKTEQKFQQLLIQRASKVITKEKVSSLTELLKQGVINKNIDIEEKEKIINLIEENKLKDSELENWSPEWAENDNLCPACGSNIIDKIDNCVNCGLKLK